MVRKSGYNLLLAADTTLLSPDPLMGLLYLETKSEGTIELVMNRVVAERLMNAVLEFLEAGKGGDAPQFAVEREQ